MQRITGAILAVYNFFVGDPIILAGVSALFLVEALLHRVGASNALAAILLVVGVLASLGGSLWRETQPKH